MNTAILILRIVAYILFVIVIEIWRRKYIKLYEKYNNLILRYRELKIKERHVNLSNIKISHWFKKTPPKPEKLERKEKYLIEHGEFESQIVLDKKLKLKDGYTSYLLAKKYNIKIVDVIII